ncbi:MAG TPA: M28 family peptidase [Bacteroidota bacterium]|nr:M28 family peptidase [Bacteroidota bacterium]
MKRINITLTFLAIIIAGCGGSSLNIENPSVTPEELKEHIRFLASDSLQGRKAGTPGNDAAAGYLAVKFREYGLMPAGDHGTFFQKFPFVSGAKPGARNSLVIEYGGTAKSFTIDQSFRTLAFSSDTSVAGEMVFGGYGITDTAQKYDDYSGVDVKGRIAVVLRFTPKGDDPHSPFVQHSTLRVKTFNAREHGAAGVIFVTGPLDSEKSELVSFSFDQGLSSSGIPVATITWTALDSIFQAEGKSVKSVQEGINTSQKPGSFQMSSKAKLETSIQKIMNESSNVIGMIPGSDPALKDEYIVIGAHFDHLGMGGQGSLAPDTVAVHHGADDNASGTAGLLEAAEYLSWSRDSLRRSIIVAGFSGEESGLLGSNYFVNHPTLPLAAMRTMINMDMIGRLTDKKVAVGGVGTSPGFDSLLNALNRDSLFSLSLKPDGYGPSDHASFYAKDIPVLFFFTNTHNDYHKPSDTWEKINYEGEAGLVVYILRIVRELDRTSQAPAFVKVASQMPQGDRRPMRVTMGVVPDYADDGGGLKITGVRPDSPAEKGGMQAGDVIVKFGDKTVSNIYDYTYLLQEHSPGDVVSVEVKRGDRVLTLSVTLAGR